MEENKQTEIKPLMNSLDNNSSPFFSAKILGILVLMVVLGLGTGFFVAKNGSSVPGLTAKAPEDSSSIKKGTKVGSNDTKTFKDSTEGKLEEGGIEGEGQYHLVRPGGDSQNVYLTSSTVDLSQFVKKKIKVWGQTQTAETAGWLMDVGRLEVLE